MSSKAPAVTRATLGAWLVKARPEGLQLDVLVHSGFGAVTSRCVRASYRTDLIVEGQPVLLWVSGGDSQHPSGIYADGETTGPAGRDANGLTMPVRLRTTDPVVPRAEILGHPVLRDVEVVRMPAGSNPSYLDMADYAVLLATFPQLARH